MTQQHAFDRLAQAWLDVMPTEAPDRVVANVLQAVETTPQVRWRWVRPATGRVPRMTRLLIGFAAIAALLIAAGIAIVGSRPNVEVSPAPSPVGGGSIPAELAVRWVGPNNPGSPFIDAGAVSLTFDSTTARLVPAGGTLVLAAKATAVGADQVRLETIDGGAQCTPGSIGTYRWRLTSGRSKLTMSDAEDTCPARQAAITGTWQRVGACGGANECTGDLEAGTYSSHNFDPHAASWSTSRSVFGAASYTVPAGWTNVSDDASNLVLKPIADYRATPEPFFDIQLLARPIAVAPDNTCGTPQPGVDHTPQALSDYIRSRQGIVVSNTGTITIDGRHGVWLDVSMASNWSKKCAEADEPSVQLLMDQAGAEHNPTGPGGWGVVGVVGPIKTRSILLDLGDGDAMLIWLGTDDPARFDELISRAMPIVQSLHFK